MLFASNHCLHTDNQIVMSSMPFVWRWRLSVAASAGVWSNPVMAVAGGLLANAFPIAREGGARRSFELLGARLDRRIQHPHLPRGRTHGRWPDEAVPGGTGLVAVESATAVVPPSCGSGRWLGWMPTGRQRPNLNGTRAAPRGAVEVVFGEPIWFPSGFPPADATTRLEEALAAL